jgi:hypothetical protein
MQKYTSTIVFVPINLPKLEQLVEGTFLNPDRIRAFLHFIITGMMKAGLTVENDSKHIKRNGYVPLHSRTILKAFLTNSYNDYLIWLISKRIISIRRSDSGGRSYIRGQFPQQYKINEKYLSNTFGHRIYRKELVEDHKVNKAFCKYYQKEKSEIMSEESTAIYEKLIEIIKNVKFNVEVAEEFCLKAKENEIMKYTKGGHPRPFNEYILLLEAWNQGLINWYSVDKFSGRLHTFYTNLWTPLREFCYFEDEPNEPLISLDISNCQAYLFSIVNAEIINDLLPEFAAIIPILESITDEPDFKHYAASCAKGQIYEVFSSARGIDRKSAKGEFMEIMFSRVKSYTRKGKEIKKIFSGLFPSVFKAFNAIKTLSEKELPFIKELYVNKKGEFEGKKAYHRSFACLNQRLEKNIFINIIAKRMIKDGIMPITIHDSVIIKSKFMLQAIEIINQSFIELGVQPPSIKCSLLNKSFMP